MVRFDELLVAPFPWMILRTLRRAEAAVGSEPERLLGSSHNLARQGIQIRIDSEGELAWSNFHDTSTSASVHREVRLVWWSDYLGNRHLRVWGILREGAYARYWHSPTEGLAPLLQIYPDAGFEVSGSGIDPSLLVICPCGATGRAEEVAWMGRECGPCHDRREGNELPSRTWDGVPRITLGGELPEQPWYAKDFLPDGRLLVDDGQDLFLWNIASGDLALHSRPEGKVLAYSPVGAGVLVLIEGTPPQTEVRLIDPVRGVVEIAARLREGQLQQYGFTASGRYLFIEQFDLFTGTSLRVWDRHKPDDGLVDVYFEHLISWDVSPDESILYVVERMGRIHTLRLGMSTDFDSLNLVAAPEEATPIEQIHYLPGGNLLIVGHGGRLRILEMPSGRVLAERHILKHFDGQIRTLVEGEGSVLLVVDGDQHQFVLVSIPDLGHLRILKPGSRPIGGLHARNDRWLALRHDRRIQVQPWPPLVDWYLREKLEA